MTQEDKNLLHIDLAARVPYSLVINVNGLGDVYIASVNWWEEVGVKNYTTATYDIADVKPYLRPMEDMTEEEEDEYELVCRKSITTQIDWLNKNMFDYRGLIPKGLALEAKEGMYNN